MKRLITFTLSLWFAASALAQTQVQTQITGSQAVPLIPLLMPSPDTPIPYDTWGKAFWQPISRDVAASGVFSIIPPPPNTAIDLNTLQALKAQLLMKSSITSEPKGNDVEYVVEVRLIDATGTTQFGKRYRGTAPALSRMAHMIANDMVKQFNGTPGIFLSQIAFASNRDGQFEIYLMDWDGANQRRITHHNALTILPSWAADNERLVYTSWAAGTSDMYIINRIGGGRIKLKTGLNLNTSATFSPVSNDIAFVGSVNGNPDIYVIKDDGSNLRRLTTTESVESTPEWSPNGRQITFTSGRGGTPQIYVMDAEGTNVRRLSFDGDWNDDATWSPDGEQVAYSSRVNGRFQIRIHNLVTGQSRIVAGEGSNEQPTWSPDGKWIAFQSNRTGRWEVYRMRVDGTDALQLTFDGENKDPDWSKKAE